MSIQILPETNIILGDFTVIIRLTGSVIAAMYTAKHQPYPRQSSADLHDFLHISRRHQSPLDDLLPFHQTGSVITDIIHPVSVREKIFPQRHIGPAAGSQKMNAFIPQQGQNLKKILRQLALFIEQRTVHIRSDQFDHLGFLLPETAKSGLFLFSHELLLRHYHSMHDSKRQEQRLSK